MKKKCLSLFVGLLVFASFIGCGNSEGVSTSTVEPVVNSERPKVDKNEALTIPQAEELRSIPVDTTSFVDYKVEGLGSTVTFKYAEEAYLSEDTSFDLGTSVTEAYIVDNMGSVEVTITTNTGQIKTAEEAEAYMTSDSNSMKDYIKDYSCKPFSIDGFEGYEEYYVYTTGDYPQRNYVVFNDELCISLRVAYMLCPEFDLEFSIE